MPAILQKTHLYEFHERHGKIIEFAGFKMPLWYRGIISEHLAVRNQVGLFDITHMGRALVTGTQSEAFLNYVTSNDVAALATSCAQYSIMCNENGGIIDDFILSRVEKEKFLVVYNAANRSKDYEWLLDHSKAFEAKIEDVSDKIAMFAVQGPRAQQTLQKIADSDLNKIERFRCGWTKLAGVKSYVSRTGYTGEDGFEVFVWNTSLQERAKVEKIWNAILEAGKEFGIQPCGLGARDTLRLEAGMCLYGNDIDENTTPLEAGLGFVVKLQKGSFIGKDALAKQRSEGANRKRVGLQMLEKGVPRRHHEIWKENKRIGQITSGTFSPIIQKGIAMAYLPIPYATKGETVSIKIRDRFANAEVVKFPFYDPKQYGYRRTADANIKPQNPS